MEREEIESKYSIRKLQNGEDTHLFDCGDEDLNDFILNEAKLYRKELLAVSYVLEQVESHLVHAYFSMAMIESPWLTLKVRRSLTDSVK